MYITYKNIEIDENKYTSEKLQSTIQEQTVEKAEENSKKVADILEETTQKIVGISKLKNTGNSILSNNTESELGLGTGIIVTEDGYILSNEHVTGSKYSKCYITLENGDSYNGTVIWSDIDLDLSITKINAKNLSYVTLGDSNQIRVGESVYAIGNPIGFEFQRTVTKGIISGINRTLKIEDTKESAYMEDLIQTDATINEGNSGGALINKNGELIGINTVKIADAEGIGFAVPINLVKPIIEKLVKNGRFEEAYLGIYGYDKNVIPYLNSNIDINSGVYIAKIQVDGPLFGAGIVEGDILTKIDENSIEKMNDLKKYIYSKNPGETVKVTIKRNNKEYEIEVKLGRKI